MNGLHALPIEVVCNHICPFLTIRDHQGFNSACSTKHLRAWLSSIYYHTSLDNGSIVTFTDLKWFHSVGVACVGIVVVLDEDTAVNALSFIATHCPTLKQLKIKLDFRLSHRPVCGVWVSLFRSCFQLESLQISIGASITDADFSVLSQHCAKLHTLRVACLRITDTAVNALCVNCPHLLHIGLEYCSRLTDASLVAIADTYPKLQTLHISGCDFTEAGIAIIANNCHMLQSVKVSYMVNITSSGLAALWAANPNLIEVDLSDNYLLSDDDVVLLLQRCVNVRELDLSFCENLTDAAIIAVAERCPNLTSIDISACDNISDAALLSLGQHSHALKSIGISYNSNITDAGIAALATGCPLLKTCSTDLPNI